MSDAPIAMRAAQPDESHALSALAMQAKAHWGYAAEQVEAWRTELTLTPESIAAQWTQCAMQEGRCIGVVQVAVAGMTGDLTHLWVDPKAMGQGAGRSMMAATFAHCRAAGVRRLTIDADPHAEAFYARFGARRVGAVPAPIPGQADRVRPQLVIDLPAQ
ncbi:MAG: GNAT family N-acetyltransferase [Betaproteobacteria bacterium]|nr:GNAT family N-acetyltransferase [Betaproteobacteria bacterium]